MAYDYAHGQPYNTTMSYDSKSIGVLVTDFSYSYELTANSSQTRQYKALYPKSFSQKNQRVSLRFVNAEKMHEFVQWVAEWQKHVTALEGSASPSPISMVGKSEMGDKIDYDILIGSVTYSNRVGTVAPTMTLNVTVVGDKWNKTFTSSGSETNGSVMPETGAARLTLTHGGGATMEIAMRNGSSASGRNATDAVDRAASVAAARNVAVSGASSVAGSIESSLFGGGSR